jgi:hypothetical protein
VTALAFGLNFGVPEVRAAWGARVIIDQHGHVDFVPGRSSQFGSEEDQDELFRVLDERVPMTKLREQIRTMLIGGLLHTRLAELVTLYEDEDVVVLGNTNASAGYLYVRGFLRKHVVAAEAQGVGT